MTRIRSDPVLFHRFLPHLEVLLLGQPLNKAGADTMSRNKHQCLLCHLIPKASYTKNLDPSSISLQVAHHIVVILPDDEEKAKSQPQQL
jgi:hypothetical protein